MHIADPRLFQNFLKKRIPICLYFQFPALLVHPRPTTKFFHPQRLPIQIIFGLFVSHFYFLFFHKENFNSVRMMTPNNTSPPILETTAGIAHFSDRLIAEFRPNTAKIASRIPTRPFHRLSYPNRKERRHSQWHPFPLCCASAYQSRGQDRQP